MQERINTLLELQLMLIQRLWLIGRERTEKILNRSFHCCGKQAPHPLKVKSLLPIEGWCQRSTTLTQTCQLHIGVMALRTFRHRGQDQDLAMEATSAAKSVSSTSMPSPKV